MSGDADIRLLGPFEVSVAGIPEKLPGDRPRATLAVLALAAGQLVPVEAIGEQVWDDPPLHLRPSVHTVVARLRQVLGPAAIVTRLGGYLLDIEPNRVDALRFGRLLGLAASARGSSEERHWLDEALGLWRGEPLVGIHASRLIESVAPQLTGRYLAAAERRIDLDLAAGADGELADELRQLIRRYPLRESLWTRLIMVLDRAGRRTEALTCYEAARRRIAHELGVEPGRELQQAYLTVLAAKSPHRPDDAASATATTPRQLPSDIDGFAGRAEALRRLDELLDADGSTARPVLITALHGASGVGKTALAVRWAHRVRSRFPDGQVYLNLRGYGPGSPTEPLPALDTLLRGLGVRGDQIPTTLEGRAGLLRTTLADRRMLIVLDNARNSEQVRPLLPGEGSSLVVVTSRSQLRGLAAREGARRIALDTLAPDESAQLLATRLDQQDVDYDDATLAELTALCGHLPLALVIAAERAGRQPNRNLTDLVRDLRNEQGRLDALETVDDPSSSMRAVLSWSYQALDPDAARLFRRLAVHPPAEFSAPAAAALAATTTAQVTPLLDRLVDANLLTLRRPERYELHDLLRVYANERGLAIDSTVDRDAATRRATSWYLHAAAGAKRAADGFPLLIDLGPVDPALTLPTFADAPQAQRWFDAEWETLVATGRYAFERGDDATVSRLALAMYTTIMARSAYVDGLDLLGFALTAARRAGDRRAEAFLADGLGTLHAVLGHADDELAWYRHSHSVFREIDDLVGEAAALGNLGVSMAERGELTESEICLKRALDLARRLGLPHEEGRALNHLALTYLATGRTVEAVMAASEAVRIRNQNGDRFEAFALDTLGSAHIAAGDYHKAIECLERAIDIQRSIGNRRSQVIALRNLGIAHQHLGDHAAARTSWRQALRIYDELRDVHSPGLSRATLLELLAQEP